MSPDFSRPNTFLCNCNCTVALWDVRVAKHVPNTNLTETLIIVFVCFINVALGVSIRKETVL